MKETKKEKRYRCSECGKVFMAKEPPASIPVAVTRCPKCGRIVFEEDEIR